MTVDKILKVIDGMRLSFTTESELQDLVHGVIKAIGNKHMREYRFDLRDRIDFLVMETDIGTLGIECKIKGSPMGVLRQLKRYEQQPQIDALMLVTSKIFSIDKSQFTKPFFMAWVSRGML